MEIITREHFNSYLQAMHEYRFKKEINPETLESTSNIFVGRTRVAAKITQWVEMENKDDSRFVDTYIKFPVANPVRKETKDHEPS